MRPNLSLESITGALAVLGAGVIMAACGGEAPKTPVDAKEVPGATDKAATGDAHCGANKDHKAGEAACSADKKAGALDAKPADPAMAAKPAEVPAAPAAPSTSATDAKGVTGTPAPATTGATKKPAAPGAAPAAAPKKAGASSCGAGTCSAKK